MHHAQTSAMDTTLEENRLKSPIYNIYTLNILFIFQN